MVRTHLFRSSGPIVGSTSTPLGSVSDRIDVGSGAPSAAAERTPRTGQYIQMAEGLRFIDRP